MTLIARGILGWDAPERRENRYGALNIAATPYDVGPVAEVFFDREAVSRLVGSKVRLTAVVRETRTSGHCGDRSLGIKPSTPEVGEILVLGVGALAMGKNHEGEPTVILMPGDGRAELWIDPRLLYRLHDQTVELHVEPTDEPCSPPPDIPPATEGMVSTGDGFQVKKVHIPPKGSLLLDLPPTIERLGGGMFAMHYETPPDGTPIKILND